MCSAEHPAQNPVQPIAHASWYCCYQPTFEPTAQTDSSILSTRLLNPSISFVDPKTCLCSTMLHGFLRPGLYNVSQNVGIKPRLHAC